MHESGVYPVEKSVFIGEMVQGFAVGEVRCKGFILGFTWNEVLKNVDRVRREQL